MSDRRPAAPPRTVPEMLERSAAAFGPLPALSRAGSPEESYTHAALHQESDDLAMALVDLGVVREERIGLFSENRPRWGVAYFAIHKAGAIAVPLDAALKERELAEIGRAADLRFAFCSPRLEPALRIALPKVRLLSLGDSTGAHVSYSGLVARGKAFARRPQLVERRPSPERLAALVFTSGTTGRAKGVALSHRNLAANVNAALESFELGPEDRFLSVLPLHHMFECTAGLLLPVAAGASVIYARGLKSRELMEDLCQARATRMLGVPLLYEKMLAGIERALAEGGILGRALMLPLYRLLRGTQAPPAFGRILLSPLRSRAGLDRLRHFVSGAAALRAETYHGFRALGVEMSEGYGLSETSPVLTFNPLGRSRVGSVGPPIAGVELRIDAPGPDGAGEVLARGENIMVGYYGNPQLTAAVMEGEWFRTGDLGRLDADGFLYLCGRKKNMIATGGGKKIYPEELEFALVGSPLIAAALVYGRPDPRSSHEDVCAILVPNWEAVEQALHVQGAAAGEAEVRALIKAEVGRVCKQLADYKRVRDFSVRREDFPRTRTGKVKRFLFQGGQELPEREG